MRSSQTNGLSKSILAAERTMVQSGERQGLYNRSAVAEQSVCKMCSAMDKEKMDKENLSAWCSSKCGRVAVLFAIMEQPIAP